MSLKLIKIISVVFGLALVISLIFLVRARWQVYGIAGWKDEVYGLAGMRGSRLALDDFHTGKLRLFELASQQDAPKFSGRRDGVFEIWYPQFYPSMGEAHRYSTEQFVEFYNRNMRYMHEHPEKFQAKTNAVHI
jgi:hypothetical protein